ANRVEEAETSHLSGSASVPVTSPRHQPLPAFRIASRHRSASFLLRNGPTATSHIHIPPGGPGFASRSAGDNSTSRFCPSASAHLCSVASVGFSILPVSKRDRAGASIPIRSATSARVRPWFSRTALNRATRRKIAAKLCRLMAPADGWRTGLAACWRRMASSSARCSAVRWGFVVGFMVSLPRLGNVVGGYRADDERIGRVQHFKHDRNKPARTRASKGNGTAGRVAHVERRIFVQERELDFFRRQAMLRDVGGITPLVLRIVPIDQGVSPVHALLP